MTGPAVVAARPDGPPRGWRAVAEPVALAVVIYLAVRFCLTLPHGGQRISPIWLPNAVALAALLSSPMRRWPLLVAAVLGGHVMAALMPATSSPLRSVVLTTAGTLEYLSAAVLIRGLVGPKLDMERPRHLVVLCVAATVCAVAAGALQSLLLHLLTGEPAARDFRAWVLSHPLSLVVTTPCLLVLSRARLRGGRWFTARAAMGLLGMAMLATAIFGQSRYPILFLALPMLVAVSLEAGMEGAALAMLTTAAVALPATMSGLGPIAVIGGDMSERAAVLQLFLTVSLFLSLLTAGMQARWRRAEATAQEEARRARRAEALALASEAHHRSLTEQASDAIGTMNMQGVLTFVSPAVEGITGYTAAELTGATLTHLIDPEDLPRVRANLRRLLSHGDDGGGPIEYRLRRKDGVWIWLQANPRVVRDGGGEPVGTVDVVRDISARKEMELELAAALEAARAGGRAKTEFLANMSHELRTPLTGILGYAEVLGSDPALPEASRRHAERIGAAGSMLLALVNDVLDLSRAEAGGLALHPRRTDLAQVLHDSVDMIRPQAQRASLALCMELSGPVTPVSVDADRLRQVVVNLLGNAVKFTARGVVTASLRCEATGGDALDVRLSVADTGMGIAADRLPHIFDRFEQADGSISRSFGGAGLGLAISRTLVRAMGGELTVESTPGSGSVFTARLRLPVAESRPVPASVAERAAPVSLAGLRVLLAEDVAVNRDLVALMLSPLGVVLQAVPDGAAAVQAADADAFDVVLMDMQMPVMDGLEATRRIRAGSGPSARARIVALTANVLPEEVARCLAAGMDDHLSKPLSAAALVAQVRAGRTPGRLAHAA